ncbi:hypothetical protein LINPERPRIM_LOCUS11984 [Linum perenne]
MYLQVTYHEEETGDNTSNPTSIDHLKYCTVLSNSKVDKHALLEALFRVCRPNHLTLIHRHKNSERFFQGILSIMQQKGGADESLMWLNGLKDVKITTQDVDVEIEKEEELIMRYSKCKTKNQLCLELTWGCELTCKNRSSADEFDGKSTSSNVCTHSIPGDLLLSAD